MSEKSERVHALVNAGPWPGMSEAFDAHMGAACWTDPAYAPDASMWAAAWKVAKRGAEALPSEVAQARETAEYWKAEHLAGNARIGELHDELAATALRSADHLRKAIKAETRADELRAVLRELVALADMKARLENLHVMGRGTDWDSYHKRHPEAWVAARLLALGPNVAIKRLP